MRKTKLSTFIFGGLILAAASCSSNTATNDVNRTVVAGNVNTVSNVNSVNNNSVADAGNVRVADITGNANNYIGKTVTVAGWVERSYNANSFRLDEDSVFTGGVDNDLLVVGATGTIPKGLKFGSNDARVSVTGVVRRMVIADIERDYGFDLTPEIEAEFRDKPVLVASSVRVVERDE